MPAGEHERAHIVRASSPPQAVQRHVVQPEFACSVGTRQVEIIGDMFNLTNHTNFANPTNNQASPQFLLQTAYSTSYAPAETTARRALRVLIRHVDDSGVLRGIPAVSRARLRSRAA